jgi:hypothetical protein
MNGGRQIQIGKYKIKMMGLLGIIVVVHVYKGATSDHCFSPLPNVLPHQSSPPASIRQMESIHIEWKWKHWGERPNGWGELVEGAEWTQKSS